jgi:aspartate 4-decarboxylase
LSPFELKNELVALARHRAERLWLNAGRGNPNWLALEPRAAFVLLEELALAEARDASVGPDLGGLPRKRGASERLARYLRERAGAPGVAFLAAGVEYAREAHGIDPDLLVGEWLDGVLGDHYPVPVRMLAHAETLVRAHLAAELFGGDAARARLELFAVEGASAGIVYVFQSLLRNGLLATGDAVAVGVPTFPPYLELPHLPEHRFEVVRVAQDPGAGWRYPAAELDKLRDPRVKLFLLVNPGNPTAVALDGEASARIAAIARARPDLVILTDDVYAPFVPGFRSLAAAAPANTIVLYSFSKFWGATGLRLGVVGIHESNVLDERLAAGDGREAARERYASLSAAPERLRFIDRLVADSRGVGLNHTAGLSTPQQVRMTLLALDGLLDRTGSRKASVREILRRRFAALYTGLGEEFPADPLHTHYYATVDVPALARSRYGAPFAEWLSRSVPPSDFVVRLAAERGIVLLDGGGFDAPNMSVRVSLANLPDDAYVPIGEAISALLGEYRERWRGAGCP